MNVRGLVLVAVLATPLAAGGCGDDSGDPTDAADLPDERAERVEARDADDADGDAGLPPTSQVDLLLVVDTGPGLAEEQAALPAYVEAMVLELLIPSYDPLLGRTPPPVEDLHLGLITADLGSGGFAVPGCAEPDEGDAGVLLAVGDGPTCLASYRALDCPDAECPWLSHSPAHPDDGTNPLDPPLWEDFACIAEPGDDGCRFRQPLAAVLRALTEAAGAGAPNAGFLRPESVLGILVVTSADDCSTSDAALFDPSDSTLGPLGTRCGLHPGSLEPATGFAEALLGLRPGREARLEFAALAGVPMDGRWAPGDPPSDLAELVEIDPADPERLLPVCASSRGAAEAPVRLAELVQALGPHGLLDSICREDWSPVFQRWTRRIQEALGH